MTPYTSPSSSEARAPSRPDFAAIKSRQRATWSTGDYAVIGATLQIVSESLCEAVDLRPGQRVLDVATGSGNTAIAAARRFAEVVGIDYVPELLARGRERVAAERLKVDLRDGDAEDLPLADATFDVVLSTFGVMFAPDHLRAAEELTRVCKSGGRIGLASWTHEGVLGESFRLISKYVPPPAGPEPATLWGRESHLRKLFGDRVSAIRFERRNFMFRYHSFDHWLELFRTWYGPVHKTFAALDAGRQVALADDLREMLTSRNCSGDGTLVYPGEYLQAILTRS